MDYRCPHCGELVDTWPDPGGGEAQFYIEDCPVCCRPNQVNAHWDERQEDFQVEVAAD
jgi:hypothetical protein